MDDSRILAAERRLDELESALERSSREAVALRADLARLRAGAVDGSRRTALTPPRDVSVGPARVLTRREARDRRRTEGGGVARDWESLVGDRLLPYAGAGLVAVGLCLLMAIAADRGYFPLEARLLLGATLSLLCIGAGIRLARDQPTRVPLGLSGAGLVGLFASAIAANETGVVGDGVLLPLLLLVVGGGLVLGRTWDHPLCGGVAVVGGALAPLLVGADATSTGIGCYGLALGAVGGALGIERRWPSVTVAAAASIAYPVASLVDDRAPALFLATLLVPTLLAAFTWYGRARGTEPTLTTSLWLGMASATACFGVGLDLIDPLVGAVVGAALVAGWSGAGWARLVPATVVIALLDVALLRTSSTLAAGWIAVALCVLGAAWGARARLSTGELRCCEALWVLQLSSALLVLVEGRIGIVQSLLVGGLLLASPAAWPERLSPEDDETRRVAHGIVGWWGLLVCAGTIAVEGDRPLAILVAVCLSLATLLGARRWRVVYPSLGLGAVGVAVVVGLLLDEGLLALSGPASGSWAESLPLIPLVLALWSARAIDPPIALRRASVLVGFGLAGGVLVHGLGERWGLVALAGLALAAIPPRLLDDPPTRTALLLGAVGVPLSARVLAGDAEALLRPIPDVLPLLALLLVATVALSLVRDLLDGRTVVAAIVAGCCATIVTEIALAGEFVGQMLASITLAAGGLALMFAPRLGRIVAVERPGRYGLWLLGLAAAKVVIYDLQTLDDVARVGSTIVSGLILLGAAWRYARVPDKLPVDEGPPTPSYDAGRPSTQ